MLAIEDRMVVLKQGRLDVFVYEKYLGGLTNISGNVVHSIGLLPYMWFAKWDDTKPTKTGTIKFPANVTFYPTDVESNKTVKIYPESDDKKYTVLSFFEKDKCWSPLLIKSMDAPMDFTQALLAAKLDTNIPYNILSPYWQLIGDKNGFDLGVPGPTMDVVIRQICRYKKDRSMLYSKALEKYPNLGQVSYQFMSSRDLCAVSGVFPAISFEDINAMIDSSINISKSGKEQNHSPVEDIIYL